MNMFMLSAHATHPGLVRKNNEDCIRTDEPTASAGIMPVKWQAPLLLRRYIPYCVQISNAPRLTAILN
jgi:hypothetical protein